MSIIYSKQLELKTLVEFRVILTMITLFRNGKEEMENSNIFTYHGLISLHDTIHIFYDTKKLPEGG